MDEIQAIEDKIKKLQPENFELTKEREISLNQENNNLP